MKFERSDISTIFLVLVAATGGIFSGTGISHSDGWNIAIGVAITTVACCFLLYNSFKNRNRLTVFVKAIRNRDTSFRMTSDDTTGRLCNEIAETLRNELLMSAQQERYYEIIINCIKIGVIVLDDNGNITKCNNEALRLFCRSSLTHLSQLAVWDGFDRTINEMSPGEKRHILTTNVRKELNISVRLDKITLREKDMRILTIYDIHTEIDRNEFDSWLKLTRVLTHEIMNGIAPISALSDSMKSDISLPEHIKEGLAAISTSSHSLANFVDAYRRFTRIPKPVPTLISISEMLKKVKCLNIHPHITVSIVPDDLIVYADEDLVMQVITNIVKNAAEALNNDTDGEIRIKAYCTETESVIIEISNNGPAIPKDDTSEIFVPFFTTKKNGNGIGLSVSRQIMLLHGGNLTHSSTPDSKFTTTFTLLFP